MRTYEISHDLSRCYKVSQGVTNTIKGWSTCINVDILEDPSSKITMVSSISKIPQTTVTGDVVAVDKNGKSDTPEIDEEDLMACEAYVYYATHLLLVLVVLSPQKEIIV
uniref:Uncharacterized protein n=1 Tax=Solanum tuberosum TaxID=4113 RepID=M1DWV2_SOLTU